MQNDLSNTSVPPDELVQFLKLSLDKRIDEYLRRLALFTVQAANLAEHVASLPQGMHTLVGHNASQLSASRASSW